MCEVFTTQQLGNRAEYKAFALYLTNHNTVTQPVSLPNRKHVFIIIISITSDLNVRVSRRHTTRQFVKLTIPEHGVEFSHKFYEHVSVCLYKLPGKMWRVRVMLIPHRLS